jgi:glycosyltransferase involved in cell wall biosynthesis
MVQKAIALSQREMEPVLFFPGDGPMPERARAAGLNVQIITNPQVSMAAAGIGRKSALIMARIRYILALRRAFRQNRLSLVYVNTVVSVFPGIAALLARLPVIWQVHELLEKPGRSTRLKMKIIEHVSNAIVYDSEAGQRLFPAEKIQRHLVHRNFIDLQALRKAAKLSPAQPFPACQMVISMNGPFYRKGGDIFVQAALQLLKESLPQQPCFFIAGSPEAADPGFYEQLLEEVHRSGAESFFCFGGVRQDIASVLGHSTLFVSASRNEALPIILCEAMALGIPVIATAVGDCATFLNDGELGTVIPPGDPVALANAIANCLNDPNAALERAEKARHKIDQEFGNPSFWNPLRELLFETAAR